MFSVGQAEKMSAMLAMRAVLSPAAGEDLDHAERPSELAKSIA